jgi:nitrate reductase gamma subunit
MSIGLLTPIALFDALGVSHGAKQIAWRRSRRNSPVGWAIHRRDAARSPAAVRSAHARASSSWSDTLIIILLWLQLALGLADHTCLDCSISTATRWSSS